ncbi:putative sugar transporter [Bimuria novae-zelandiae CBS 107.79]|uniref:Quinate transporter n=1 Tax=Bimuria novae-zelandiae CBS 107.79 TaxID=1447943 RepID=A0A6A5VAD2_9PLEO|nr:putative sugar transporter [Bimuria novae-zelandiae CBS 107.79]
MYGYDSAFIGGTMALPSFKHRYGLDTANSDESTNLSSNIVSTFQAGALFGAIAGFFIAERWGRMVTIMGGGALFMVGAGLMLHGTLGVLYGGRVLTGLSIGATSTIIPIYIAECSPALIRGRLVGMFEIMLQVALVFGFWINYGVEKNISGQRDQQWHIPVAAQFVPAGLLLISMPFIVESPRWLVSNNRVSHGKKALCSVRNLPMDHDYIKAEMEEIQASITHELEVSGGRRSTSQICRELGAPGIRSCVIIAVILMLLQNLTGINVSPQAAEATRNADRPGDQLLLFHHLKAIGYSGTSVGLLATGVYGLVKMFTTLIFMVFFVDRFGRRPARLVGAVGAMAAMFYLAGYSALSGSFEGKTPARDSGAQAALAMIYIYAIFYGFSWNGIPWIFASELLPNRVRTLGMMCAVCMQWLAQFVVVYSLPHMVADITYSTSIFFGACTVIAILFAFFFVPETKGVALEDINIMFGSGAPLFARSARKRYNEAHEAGINMVNIAHVEGKKRESLRQEEA